MVFSVMLIVVIDDLIWSHKVQGGYQSGFTVIHMSDLRLGTNISVEKYEYDSGIDERQTSLV